MDSKFCGLIAYIIYCLSKNFDKMNEVIVLDNTTNNILLFNSVYDAKNQKYRIMDYIRNSVVVGENSQFIDFKTKKMVLFNKVGMIFRGVVTPKIDLFVGSIIKDKVTIIFSDETYTFDCKSMNEDIRYKKKSSE